jgi:uncharacterized protein (DUF697 family)/tellurite resistance protein
MTTADHEAIISIALMAARADGTTSPEEQAQLQSSITAFGLTSLDAVARDVIARGLSPQEVAKKLSGDEARKLAYDTALVVCHTDGEPNAKELAFLDELRIALGLSEAAVAPSDRSAAALQSATVSTGAPPVDASLDDMILKQAMITGALEILPEGLANLGILPLQMRMVYQIGQHYGQQLDRDQVKDLASTLGLGAAAQVMEGVVRKVLGGAGRGLLGGLLGGAVGSAAGGAVTFATTYALGHVAQQYYAQGRKLSRDDLRALFARFQSEAKTIFPKVEQQISAQAKTLNLSNLLGTR